MVHILTSLYDNWILTFNTPLVLWVWPLRNTLFFFFFLEKDHMNRLPNPTQGIIHCNSSSYWCENFEWDSSWHTKNSNQIIFHVKNINGKWRLHHMIWFHVAYKKSILNEIKLSMFSIMSIDIENDNSSCSW
jgi:hypothetical protein